MEAPPRAEHAAGRRTQPALKGQVGVAESGRTELAAERFAERLAVEMNFASDPFPNCIRFRRENLRPECKICNLNQKISAIVRVRKVAGRGDFFSKV